MKTIIFFSICLLLLSSCASLGTKQLVVRPEVLNGMKNIGIGPHRYNFYAYAEKEIVYPLFDRELLSALRGKKYFRTIVVTDSLTEGIDPQMKDASQKLFEKARTMGLDGVLFCDFNLYKSSYMFTPINDAEVTITVYSTFDEKLVSETTFSTKLGASYMLPPDVATITKDATITAVDAFMKIFTRK